MENELIKEEFFKKYPSIEEEIIKNKIEWNNLKNIYLDFNKYKDNL